MLLQQLKLTSEQKIQHRILTAAERLFAAQGYDRTTTKQLAELSGVAEGTLFRHFESKKSILAAVMSRGWDALLNDLLETLCEVSDCQDMVGLLRHRLQDVHLHADLVKVCLIQTPFHPELCQAIQHQRLRQMLEVLEAYIQNGIDRGFYRPLKASNVAQVLLAIFLGMSWFDNPLLDARDIPQAEAQVADTLADILMNGLLLKVQGTESRPSHKNSAEGSALPTS
ncbi:TetR/AcrR family transcriptional regulator [Altericista sp. CCNU0014]|uniref:TetR/AcrR family transcriptional regulator n=1 Tax=Altericista sp. CCNU0014 TaxID=3082949 RepID=UPI00384F64BC